MKILMFSADPSVFVAETPAWKRMKEYAQGIEKLEIVLTNKNGPNLGSLINSYWEAKAKLETERYDLITAQEIEHSFMAWRLSKIFNIGFQMQIHTDIFSPYFVRQSFKNKVRVLMAKKLIPKASCIRVVSKRIAESIEKEAGRKSGIEILPIYSEAKEIGDVNIKAKYPGYDLYLLAVSRLAPEKNIELAVGVLSDLKKSLNPVLVIVGDGPRKNNIELNIKKYNLGANVRFEGWQDSLAGYYQSADLLLITSNFEGYNMAAVEALQNGLPVIMTNVGIAGDIVQDGVNGQIALVGDKTGLASCVLKFFSDEQLRVKLKGGALSTPMPYKSFEDYKEKLVNSWRTCQK